MANPGQSQLPYLDINTAAILMRADSSNDMLTYPSSLRGVFYIIDNYGGIMFLERHGYYRAQWEDLQVMVEELKWILSEAERWQRS